MYPTIIFLSFFINPFNRAFLQQLISYYCSFLTVDNLSLTSCTNHRRKSREIWYAYNFDAAVNNSSWNRCYSIIPHFSLNIIIRHVVHVINCLIAALTFANLDVIYDMST